MHEAAWGPYPWDTLKLKLTLCSKDLAIKLPKFSFLSQTCPARTARQRRVQGPQAPPRLPPLPPPKGPGRPSLPAGRLSLPLSPRLQAGRTFPGGGLATVVEAVKCKCPLLSVVFLHREVPLEGLERTGTEEAACRGLGPACPGAQAPPTAPGWRHSSLCESAPHPEAPQSRQFRRSSQQHPRCGLLPFTGSSQIHLQPAPLSHTCQPAGSTGSRPGPPGAGGGEQTCTDVKALLAQPPWALPAGRPLSPPSTLKVCPVRSRPRLSQGRLPLGAERAGKGPFWVGQRAQQVWAGSVESPVPSVRAQAESPALKEATGTCEEGGAALTGAAGQAPLPPLSPRPPRW